MEESNMNSNNRHKHIVVTFAGLLLLSILASANVLHQSKTEDPEALRQILANQPDFMATQHFIFSEGFGGFGATSKVAKLANRGRAEMDDAIIITELGKPAIKLYPKRKEYSVIKVVEANLPEFDFRPEALAKRDDVIFKLLGKEKIGEYSCLKIEVTFKDEKLKGMSFLCYAATDLKNLVIAEEVIMGTKAKFMIVLKDISLDVSEEIFRIPTGYKKIIEPDRTKEIKELEDMLRKPR
jgi:hypothetical protein